MSSLHQIVDPLTAFRQPQTDVSGGGLVSVPGLSFLGASESFLCTTFEAKMPKGPVIQDTSILGKGRNLSMEVFSRCPKFPYSSHRKGCPQKEDKHRGGQPFHPSILVIGIK